MGDDSPGGGAGRATETPDDAPAAELDDVALSFGDVRVLDGVSLDVSAGAVTTVVGPNGSGKTTLLRVLAGVLALDSGARRVPDAPERPVGYLPQDPRFRPRFSVEETLRYYADLLVADTDVESSMERVGLLGVRDRRVGQLSGGMRRLLGVAVSLLGDPPVVVLDEPTSGLDPRMQRHVSETAAAVAAEGTAVVVSSHDLAAAERTDSVVILDGGTVRLRGPPAELIADAAADSLTDAVLDALPDDPTVQSGARGER